MIGRLRISILLIALLFAGPLEAAGLTPDQRAAAQREGAVNWYTVEATGAAREIAAAAEKAIGIHVNITRMSSGQVTTRILQEQAGNIANADLFNVNLVQPFIDLKEKHQLLQFTPSSISSYADKGYYDPDHYWHLLALSLGTIQYNTELIRGDLIPHSWKDLTDPRYSGKIAMGDPRLGGSSATGFYFLSKMYGWGYFEALKKNGAISVNDCTQANLLASGERPILMCDHGMTPAGQAQHLPIETVFPTDAVFVSPQPVGILANAPHPNAAMLFVDWLTSPAAQSLIVGTGLGTPLNDPSVAWPAKYPPMSSMKLMVINPQDFAAWLPEAKQKWSELFGG